MNATRTCSVDGCAREFFSKNFCKAHYLRNYKYGDPLAGKPMAGLSYRDRLLSKIAKSSETGCWNWTGASSAGGYGRFNFKGKRGYPAHRAAYEVFVGPVPDGLVIDHLCRNRGCINPDHLEPVTPRENLVRGESVVAAGMKRNACKVGHELSGENLGVSSVGGRRCVECDRQYQREYDKRTRNHTPHENCGIDLTGLGNELLAVWGSDESFVRSRDLIDRLVAANPERWGVNSCNGRKLSPQRMVPHVATELGIRTRKDAAGHVGYFRSDLAAKYRREEA